jgi:hypothetical protein
MTPQDEIQSIKDEIKSIKSEMECRRDMGVYFKLRRAEMRLEEAEQRLIDHRHPDTVALLQQPSDSQVTPSPTR